MILSAPVLQMDTTPTLLLSTHAPHAALRPVVKARARAANRSCLLATSLPRESREIFRKLRLSPHLLRELEIDLSEDAADEADAPRESSRAPHAQTNQRARSSSSSGSGAGGGDSGERSPELSPETGERIESGDRCTVIRSL